MCNGQQITIKPIEPQNDASFRAVSVVDDRVAWVSGTKGTVGLTLDGGATWKFTNVAGAETLDFRSLYAFDDKKAVIANAGFPANIMLTTDAGASWRKVFTLNDSAAFIDGVDFFNEKEGVMYGDPMNGKMLLLRTKDGGLTWSEYPSDSKPSLEEGEASFAASGTNIRAYDKTKMLIGTGGRISRLWMSDDKGSSWKSISVPILQGQSSTGIFSVAQNKKTLVVVGGDYLQETLRSKHVFLSHDFGKSWSAPAKTTGGYRECVEFLGESLLIATGPSGTDISSDKGNTWNTISGREGYHVVRKARRGKLTIIAGGRGKIGVVQWDQKK